MRFITTRKGKRVVYARELDALKHTALCYTCRLRNVCCYKSAVMETWERHGLVAAVYQCPDYVEKK